MILTISAFASNVEGLKKFIVRARKERDKLMDINRLDTRYRVLRLISSSKPIDEITLLTNLITKAVQNANFRLEKDGSG